MSKKIIAIVPAAGVGQRAQTAPSNRPKQYRLLGGKPMLRWAVEALLADARIEQVRVAISATDDWAQQVLSDLPRTLCRPCGGPTRAETVLGALRDADLSDQDWVLVHDAARPGLPASALARLIDVCLDDPVGGLLAQPVPDTVKLSADPDSDDQAPAHGSSTSHDRVAVEKTVSRDRLWLAQTPQMFPVGMLKAAMTQALAQGLPVTDEASAIELAGWAPRLVPGSARNFKVTWPEDFDLMEKWL